MQKFKWVLEIAVKQEEHSFKQKEYGWKEGIEKIRALKSEWAAHERKKWATNVFVKQEGYFSTKSSQTEERK